MPVKHARSQLNASGTSRTDPLSQEGPWILDYTNAYSQALSATLGLSAMANGNL